MSRLSNADIERLRLERDVYRELFEELYEKYEASPDGRRLGGMATGRRGAAQTAAHARKLVPAAEKLIANGMSHSAAAETLANTYHLSADRIRKILRAHLATK